MDHDLIRVQCNQLNAVAALHTRGVLADTCLSPRHIILSKALPVEVTARVWDMFFLEGPVPSSAVALCVVGVTDA